MSRVKLLPLTAGLALLALAACDVPTLKQRKVLDATIGKSEVDVVREFGVPTRTYTAGDHSFLAYIDNETQYTGGGGWGWGGWGGWGGGWGGWGGWGGGWGPGWGGGWGGGFPATYYNTSCQTTFELVSGRVVAWTMRGDGC